MSNVVAIRRDNCSITLPISAKLNIGCIEYLFRYFNLFVQVRITNRDDKVNYLNYIRTHCNRILAIKPQDYAGC